MRCSLNITVNILTDFMELEKKKKKFNRQISNNIKINRNIHVIKQRNLFQIGL